MMAPGRMNDATTDMEVEGGGRRKKVTSVMWRRADKRRVKKSNLRNERVSSYAQGNRAYLTVSMLLSRARARDTPVVPRPSSKRRFTRRHGTAPSFEGVAK